MIHPEDWGPIHVGKKAPVWSPTERNPRMFMTPRPSTVASTASVETGRTETSRTKSTAREEDLLAAEGGRRGGDLNHAQGRLDEIRASLLGKNDMPRRLQNRGDYSQRNLEGDFERLALPHEQHALNKAYALRNLHGAQSDSTGWVQREKRWRENVGEQREARPDLRRGARELGATPAARSPNGKALRSVSSGEPLFSAPPKSRTELLAQRRVQREIEGGAKLQERFDDSVLGTACGVGSSEVNNRIASDITAGFDRGLEQYIKGKQKRG